MFSFHLPQKQCLLSPPETLFCLTINVIADQADLPNYVEQLVQLPFLEQHSRKGTGSPLMRVLRVSLGIPTEEAFGGAFLFQCSLLVQ